MTTNNSASTEISDLYAHYLCKVDIKYTNFH